MSWKDFLSELGVILEPAPEASPIPPGFFTGLSVPVVSLSGRDEIEEYLEERSRTWETESESGRKDTASAAAMNEHKPLLLELLYCRQGCHMGDGVR